MLSKKMAVSLTSLILILALAFVVSPSAMAANFKVKIEGRTAAAYTLDNATTLNTDVLNIDLTITSDRPIPDLTGATTLAVPTVETGGSANAILTVKAYNRLGIEVSTSTGVTVLDLPQGTGVGQFADRSSTLRKLRVAITPAAVSPATTPPTGVITKVVVKIDELTTTDLGVAAGDSKSDVALHTITILQPVLEETKRPKVVSIQRLRPGSQTVVAAFQEAKVTTTSFDVRIVLTEAGVDWKPDKINDRIEVVGGTASNLVVGNPFAWYAGVTTDDPPVVRTMTETNRQHTVTPNPIEGRYMHSRAGPLASVPQGELGYIPLPSGNDNMYHQYRVTIHPHRRAKEVKIKVKTFHDDGDGTSYKNYYQQINVDIKPNGRERLDLDVDLALFDLDDGYKVILPHEGGKAKITYAGKAGHYILAKDKALSGINYFNYENADNPNRENKPKEQTPAQLLYNVRDAYAAPNLPADSATLPNLETFLLNNGTIHLVSYGGHKAGDAYISEVMWGTDASLADVSDSNWIEIRNGTGGAIEVKDKIWALWFYEAHETPAPAYPADSPYEGPTGQAGTIIDTIGTKASDTGLHWSLAGKGQSGRTNIDIARANQEVLTPTTPLISMYRVMNADGTLSDGTQKASWMQTPSPSVNLKIGRENAYIATPGAAPFDTPDTLQAEKDKQKAKEDQAKADAEKIANTGTYPKAGQGRVYISEIMFAGGGTLPQWIEISNGDRSAEFNLSGWTLTVDNAVADADVDVASATFTIPNGTTIDPSAQHDTPSTILVVTEQGRNNLTGAKASGQVINLAVANEVDLITAGVLRGKYSLLSDMGFQITLAPPVPKATKAPAGETAAAKATRLANEKKEAALRKAATDMVGNLGKDGAAAWALPMNAEGGRSSIIRRHVQVVRGPAAPEDGMMEDNWVLASETGFAQITHIRAQSYYGAANDVGTPGFRAGGALPVELSHFRPTRDKATGQVVITWATQSELNNAGFFIKRSQQRAGEFKVINATMIAGAGTTSEKQFYTYTDTTAQPNVVYYYQIEDVSLDGNRQTLTRGIRLKGHVGAAGKATTLWGELKTSHE